MNISDENRAQILAAISRVKQDIRRIQKNGVSNSFPEMEQLSQELQTLIHELQALTRQ